VTSKKVFSSISLIAALPQLNCLKCFSFSPKFWLMFSKMRFKFKKSVPPHEIPLSSHLQGCSTSGDGHKQLACFRNTNTNESLTLENS
jgi:hypothetical protein